MQLFYNELIDRDFGEIVFDKEESRHIVKVLRKKIGDTIFITNGRGLLFITEVIDDNEKRCSCIVKSVEEKQKHPYYLHIGIAPTKNNDRTEWFLEKATEIGVDEITPLICGNSERVVVNEERFERVIVSAMKQSLHFHKPKLNGAVKFNDFIEKENSGGLYIAHCYEEDRQELSEALKRDFRDRITVLIGPEGDFTIEEVHKSILKKYTPILLGNTRLRTETAGVVACTTVSIINAIR